MELHRVVRRVGFNTEDLNNTFAQNVYLKKFKSNIIIYQTRKDKVLWINITKPSPRVK